MTAKCKECGANNIVNPDKNVFFCRKCGRKNDTSWTVANEEQAEGRFHRKKE